MKNKVIAILLLLALLLSTAACADDCCCVCKTEETNGDTEAATPAALIAQADPASENTAVKEAAEAVQIGQPEKTDFSLGYLNSTAHLLGFVAREEGYFQEEGLNVDLIQFSSAAELSTGLESGKLDVAFIGSVPTLTFQSKGHDLTVFGGAMTNGHGYVIKPEYTEGLESWDISILKGRNVASVKNSVQDAELQILLKNADIEIGEGEDKVNIIYFDSQKDAFAALQNGSIDAASVYSPYASLAEGLMLLTPFSADAEDELTQNFVKNYEAAYGGTPIQFAADSYDGMFQLKAALEAGNADPSMSASEICDILVEQMPKIKIEHGLTGEDMTFTEEGEPNKAPKAVVIEGGVYKSIE